MYSTTASKAKQSVRTRSGAAKRPARPSVSATLTRKSASGKVAPAAITNYTTALRWLYSHVDYERMRIVPYNKRTFNLDRMRKLLSLLGNPHDEIRCVQVAGTKGKGSTCAMLASMLKACGYTTGLFTSPHLVDLRERIAIDGQIISYVDITDLFKSIAVGIKKLSGDPPSFFEIMTAVALRYFADQAVDITLLETGLGGRLDSTTVVKPLICGMTQISLDHANILGDDLATIAREKAGIFKKDISAVSVKQSPNVAQVLDAVAVESQTPLEYTGREIDFSFRFEADRELGPHTRVNVTTPSSRFEHLPVPLRGEHQAYNCGLALSLLDKLKSHGFSFRDDQVIPGLAQTKLAGRMEQVWAEPRVIIDGAHNAASIQALIRALGAHIAYDSMVLIFGTGQDKDITGMLEQIALGADKVIFTRAKNNPRAVEPEDLMTQFNDVSGKMAQTSPLLVDALKLASRAVSREDLIVITGSFYLVGEAKKYFDDRANKRQRSK